MHKILIVDDNYYNIFLFQTILMDNNYECKAVSSGKKAIEELKKNNYDLIIMDIEMPEMNGIETTKYIRTKFESPKKKIPIIACTVHTDFNDRIIKAGFNQILYKNIKKEILLDVIKKNIL